MSNLASNSKRKLILERLSRFALALLLAVSLPLGSLRPAYG